MLTRIYDHLSALTVVAVTASLCCCQFGPAPTQPLGAAYKKPLEAKSPWFLRDPVRHRYYGGSHNDLLTAGLGIEGLQGPPPAFDDPLAPNAEELRRNHIHYNYNALVNTAAEGGFGTLYGPRPGAERVSGHEYLTVSRYANGDIAATLMVQVPEHFDSKAPCIVTAPSSGSRGIYGAIGGPGQWGLNRGCAVAYTDKGTGTGFYFSDSQQGYDMLGRLTTSGKKEALFAPDRAPERHRLAVKHSHSGHNVERDWGRFVLQSIQLAFHVLNRHHPVQQPYTRENTLVIASGISNGGASALKAAEQDKEGWIDAVVVAEPNIQLAKSIPGVKDLTQFDSRGAIPMPRPLLDIASHFALYQGCASLAPELPGAKALAPPLRQTLGNRCRALEKLGLLHGESLDALARAAQSKLLDYGVLPETLPLGLFSTKVQLWEAIAVTYTSAYGRYSAANPVCGISFAYTDAQGEPAPAPAPLRARLATASGGIPPVAGIELIHEDGSNGAKALAYQIDGDDALAPALCLRGTFQARPVQQGLREVLFKADLGGRPAIIVHGRHDHLIHVNHSSRPYLALNRQREGDRSQLRYYEITHGQHFDALLRLPPFAAAYIPLHHYYDQAMDIMWSHLKTGGSLPPSQVVFARPGAAGAAPRLPEIAQQPGTAAIQFNGKVMHIP